MVVRKQNLLDAFRHAAPDGRKSALSAGIPPSAAGGPFSPAPAPRTESAAPRPRFEPAGRPSSAAEDELPVPEIPSTFRWLLSERKFRAIVLAAVLVGVGAYFAGRFTAKPARAADPRAGDVSSAADASRGALSDGIAAGASLVERNQAAARMGSPVDKAFMDPANKFTIQLIQYKDDDAGQKLARDTAEFLRKQAIPVVSPVRLGKSVVLFADAKPKTSDLAGLLQHVKSLSGPPPQEKRTPFSSALVVNIDDVVKRR